MIIDTTRRTGIWIPMSLKMFVMILAVLGVPSAWLVARGYQQLRLIRQIEQMGGKVYSDPFGPKWLRNLGGDEWARMFDEVYLVSLTKQGTDATLNQICGMPHLKTIWLNDVPVSDAGLAQLRRAGALTTLGLKNMRVTDAGLAHLNGLTSLESLWLDGGTPVTDAGLVHLKGLTHLELLWLEDTHVTDAGLPNLLGLTQLWRLSLGRTRVTDAGLKHLKGLVNLRDLRLEETAVTDAGVTELEHALPQLNVTR